MAVFVALNVGSESDVGASIFHLATNDFLVRPLVNLHVVQRFHIKVNYSAVVAVNPSSE